MHNVLLTFTSTMTVISHWLTYLNVWSMTCRK